mmetsp:Transcript_19055/g.32631  ORF Transcript_19055/g.32631 Transcript_19055/m.32631 type:complete len:85 (+) Transcript_19055:170-424(+)
MLAILRRLKEMEQGLNPEDLHDGENQEEIVMQKQQQQKERMDDDEFAAVADIAIDLLDTFVASNLDLKRRMRSNNEVAVNNSKY